MLIPEAANIFTEHGWNNLPGPIAAVPDPLIHNLNEHEASLSAKPPIENIETVRPKMDLVHH